MLQNVTRLVKSVFGHTTEKEQFEEELENTRSLLKGTVNESIEHVKEYFTEANFDKDKLKRLEEAFSVVGSKETKPIRFINETEKYVHELIDGLDLLESIAKVEMEDIVTDKTTTARSGAIIGTLMNITSVSLYLPDFLLFIMYAINDDKMVYNKKLKDIKVGGFSYATIFKQYRGNLKKIINEIPKLSNTVVNDDFKTLASMNDKKFSLPINNFIGNPIYHFRMWLVDREVKKLEVTKDKAELLRLKIAELKTKQHGEPDTALQKQIEYYEKKLQKTEFEIQKLESID